ncbi:MAG: amino acid adenylation domain-containing protein, partial [bacterium]|nr:amino acid adenylation domain-containing protein [bacterium]
MPLPPLEVALRQRVARLLRLPPDQIPADRPLVALGLDSLTATELEYALARELGASVPARRLLDGLSIETLVRELANADEPRTPSPRSPLANAGEHPLSDGQRALWFLHRLAPESSAYHVAFAFWVHSRLDRSALSRALDRLTQRHPALRTTFHAPQGEPLERLHDQLTAEFVGEAGCLRKEAFRPFDPETGPLLRLGLFQETGGDVLLLVMHHLITDFRSSAMLLRELGLLYRQERGGAPAELLPLPRSYHDFVRHQRELLASAEGERLASYWRRQLAGAPATIELPVDRARPAVASWAGASAVLRFGTRLSQSVRRLAGAESATLFSTLLASFQTLLHRYSGQPQLLVGSPAGRTTDVFDDVVGYFANPLVLRADFSGDLTFSGFLARIRRTVLDALDHKDYPFPRLVEALEPERDASRSPLFQVMFTFEPTRRPEDELLAACLVGRAGIAHELGALALESMRLPEEASQFDLTLTMAEVEGELAASLVYNTDLFDATTARRLLVHLHNLLAGVAADPGRDLAALPLLSAGERQQLLVEWNATREELASELCLPQLFERQAARTPDAVAVVCGSRQLSYRELNERANGLAHRLHALGIGAEDRVGIRLERSPELVVGVLAVLKAGGAWVPLDPALPEARMAYQRDASGAVPLPNPHPPGPLSQTDPPPARERGRMRGKWRNESAHGDHLAYVIFTSGSTGKPKGVPITHRALVNFLRAMAGRPGLTAADTLLAVTTPSFDIAILELFLPLVCGGRVVVAPREVTADGERLAELLAASGATVMQATPATWRLLIAAGWRGDARLRILCGGEALPRELAGELAARGSALWNLYGPTETTIWSAVERVGSAPESATTSIGRPIANTRIHVLDRRLGPVPVGVPGELMIAGAGLSRGYLGRPGLSAAQFIPDPFSSQPGERLYRTGDRARYRGDGALEYLGRSDHQIKIRGFRIEPGEIETLLAEHPAVHAAVVISHLSPSGGTRAAAAGDERLVAYFVPRPGTAVSATELRRRLEHRLPDYMVPAVFVALPALPLTPSGKVDRQALPAAGGDAGTGAAWVAPRTPVEEILTEIWATILDRRRIGAHDNFFALGGHSLLAVRVLSRVRQALDCELPVRSLFERPTVARFATLVETSGGEASSTPPLVATARPAEIPLSFGQERLWFLDQVLAVRTAYNMPAAVRFRGTLHLSPSGGTPHLSPSGGTPHL